MKLLFILLIASFSTTPLKPVEILPDNVKKHVGERVKVCGKITDTKFYENSRLTVMSMATNNQPLNVIISADDRKNFSYKPEQFLKNKYVCITGKVIDNNGKAELVLNGQDDLFMDDEDYDFDIKANIFDFFNKYFDD